MLGQTCMFRGGCGSLHRESVADMVQDIRSLSRKDGRSETYLVEHHCKRHGAFSMPSENWKVRREQRSRALLFLAFVGNNDRVRVAVEQAAIANELRIFATVRQMTCIENLVTFPRVCYCQISSKIRTNPTLPVVSYYRCRSTASKLRRCAQNPMAEA